MDWTSSCVCAYAQVCTWRPPGPRPGLRPGPRAAALPGEATAQRPPALLSFGLGLALAGTAGADRAIQRSVEKRPHKRGGERASDVDPEGLATPAVPPVLALPHHRADDARRVDAAAGERSERQVRHRHG
eukprot:scaffold66497_cov95-Phaeocystis_antarctica.AAC.2